MSEKPLLEVLEELTADIPESEWNKLPPDLSLGWHEMVKRREATIEYQNNQLEEKWK